MLRDDIDGTKKFQIQCSTITAGQTRVINAPDYSGYLVGSSNIPSNGTVLIGGTIPIWSTLSTQNLTDIYQNNVFNNEILVYNSTTTRWEASNALTTLQSSLGPLNSSIKPYGGGNGGSGIAHNATFTMQNYVDNTDGNMFNQYTTTGSITPVTSFNCSTNEQPYLSLSSNLISDSSGTRYTTITAPWRLNVDFGSARVFVSFFLFIPGTVYDGNVIVYGSNSISSYNDISTSTAATDPNLTVLLSMVFVGGINHSYVSGDTTNSYRYLHLLCTCSAHTALYQFSANYGSLVVSNLVQGTDYTLSSDATSGYPMIKNLRAPPHRVTVTVYRIYIKLLNTICYTARPTGNKLFETMYGLEIYFLFFHFVVWS